MTRCRTSNQIHCHLFSSHAHLLAHLVSEALFPVTQIFPVILCQFVSNVGAVRKAVMMPFFLGSIVAITFPPSGLLLVPHKLVKVIVVSLSFPLILFASVVLLSLSATVLLPLLLVAVSLPSSGETGGLTATCMSTTQKLQQLIKLLLCEIFKLNRNVNYFSLESFDFVCPPVLSHLPLSVSPLSLLSFTWSESTSSSLSLFLRSCKIADLVRYSKKKKKRIPKNNIK